jgi:hypothetical protein
MNQTLSLSLRASFQGSLESEFISKYFSGDIERKVIVEIESFSVEVERLVKQYDRVRELPEVEIPIFKLSYSEYFSVKHFYYHAMSDVSKYVISGTWLSVYVDMEDLLRVMVAELSKRINEVIAGGLK